MKVILKSFPKVVPKEIIESNIRMLSKNRREIKAEIRGNYIILFYIDNEIINELK